MMGNALLGGLGPPPDPRVKFWSDAKSWPDDCDGYVFAARGILEAGSLFYPTEWSDDAPVTQLLSELPERYDIWTSRNDIQRACELLQANHDPYIDRNPRGLGGILGPGLDFPTREDWVVARKLAKSESNQSWERYLPFARLAIRLAAEAKSGRLLTATRPKVGGALHDQEWHFWNSERAWLRLETCDVSDSGPFEINSKSEPRSWLYFKQADLDALLKGKSQEDRSASGPETNTIRETLQQQRRGRKESYDWDGAIAEFVRLVRNHEIDDQTDQVTIIEMLEDWAEQRWNLLPERSTWAKKVRKWQEGLRPRDL